MSEAPLGSVAAAAAPAGGSGELRERYAEAVARRHFRSDPAQLAALAKLEELRGRLIAAAPARGARLAQWLEALKIGRAHV